MLRDILFTFSSIAILTLLVPIDSYAKSEPCSEFERHFKALSTLERQFSRLKHKKINMQGARSVINEAVGELLEARVPLVAMDPQKARPNHRAICRSASEKFKKELQEAQESLAELRAFGPMMG